MVKSAQAFRTIGEVSEALDTPAHVLRFWESKFTQVRPVKRAGGRRYYRPEDLDLLCGIKLLLHDRGMTIKGVQKLLREKGVRHVAGEGRNANLAPAARSNPLASPAARGGAEIEDAVIVLDPPALTGAAAGNAAALSEVPPLALLHAAGRAHLAGRAARIAPIVARLEALRARMAGARDGKR